MAHGGSVLWVGKPWIVPSILARSVLIVVIGAVFVWLEFLFGVADKTIASLLSKVISLSSVPLVSSWSLISWTGLVFFLVWVFSMVHLLLLRVSYTYILHNDSLEIRSGILSSRAFAVSPSGFSDLEVFRSVVGRIMDSGDIIVRTQSETSNAKKMVRVRHPLKVADQIREVMARPIVRTQGSEQRI